LRDDTEKLRDILEAIERIEKYAPKGRKAFERDELVQVWMVRHLEIIGEACRTLPESFREKNPDVAWRAIIGMRNILAHHYFEIDLEIVWNAVELEIPKLKRRIQVILDE